MNQNQVIIKYCTSFPWYLCSEWAAKNYSCFQNELFEDCLGLKPKERFIFRLFVMTN